MAMKLRVKLFVLLAVFSFNFGSAVAQEQKAYAVALVEIKAQVDEFRKV